MNMINPISFTDYKKIFVDDWTPGPEDKIMRHAKDVMILPVSSWFGTQVPSLDYFMVSTKKCYNLDKTRDRITHYINYFFKFYDYDKELLAIYCRIKYLMDYEEAYSLEAFIFDIQKYVLSQSILYKVDLMNRDNYQLSLDFKGTKNQALQYTDKHAMMLMKMSVIMNILIPLICHFIYVKGISNSNEFVLQIYDHVFDIFDIDLYSKLYETSSYNVDRSMSPHEALLDKQSIRGINMTTHSLASVENIILNIIPKYTYNQNIIHFNYTSIRDNTRFQVIDLAYEYAFVKLSSSKRDEDNNSEFDKFESYLVKQDESLYIQSTVNCQETMKKIELFYGPFDQEEINFYLENITSMEGIQKELIFNLFYKYFGDPVSIKAINKEQYVKLMISAKRLLQVNNMVILPYILSSKITRLVTRKNLNKREYLKTTMSSLYQTVMNAYKSEKVEKLILSIIATILSSDFEILEFHDKELNGMPLEVISDIINEELLMFISLIIE